jgi:hypothetical protein
MKPAKKDRKSLKSVPAQEEEIELDPEVLDQ